MATPAVPPPALSSEERHLYEAGVEQFNERLFFECHDTLEELWTGLRGPSRDFFQGLIQVAVGFHHLGNGNRVGAERLMGRALERLAGYPDRYAGLELDVLREQVRRWHRDLVDGADLTGRVPPRLAFDPDGAPTPDAGGGDR